MGLSDEDLKLRLSAVELAIESGAGEGYITATERLRNLVAVAAGIVDYLEYGDADGAVRTTRLLEENEELGMGPEPEVDTSITGWWPATEVGSVDNAIRFSADPADRPGWIDEAAEWRARVEKRGEG